MIFYPDSLPSDYVYSFEGYFEERNFEPEPGVIINSLHFKVEQPRGLILYYHGNAGNLAGWGSVAGQFTRLGFDVLIYDYRGYGKSSGEISEIALFDDSRFIYSELSEEYSEENIILYGRSIGSGLAVHTASENKPGRLILESPFYSLSDLANSFYPWLPTFLLKYPMRSDKYIADVSCPVTIFHGTEDNIIYYGSSQKLIEKIKTEFKLISIEGGGHNNLSGFEKYYVELSNALSE